jgi:hypothetical protein
MSGFRNLIRRSEVPPPIEPRSTPRRTGVEAVGLEGEQLERMTNCAGWGAYSQRRTDAL